jgi:hypothetical protein
MDIIFIHKGDSWYLSYALNQVKKTNPYANVVLLGDVHNLKYSKIINHEFISDYFSKAASFSNIYKHFSTTNHSHELFCIQRWFVWMEYMKAKNIHSAILPDTDVLFFQPITQFIESLDSSFQFSKGTTNYMGFMYMKTKYLEDVCSFFESQYQNTKFVSELEQAYLDYVKVNGHGGVSDITLFDRYEKEHPNCTVNLEIPPLKNVAFINSLESKFYYLNKEGCVDVIWKRGIPYAKLLTGEIISVLGIHCFGLQKEYIRKLYNGKGLFKSRLVFYWKRSVFKKILDIVRGRRR